MTTIKVTINPDGKNCREVNPLGEPPKFRAYQYREYMRDLSQWKEVEDDLRTFEIDSTKIYSSVSGQEFTFSFIPGSTHTAEIIEEYPETRGGIHGKCKIIS